MSGLPAKPLSCILGTIPHAQGGFVNFFQMMTECCTPRGTSKSCFSTQVNISSHLSLSRPIWNPVFYLLEKPLKPFHGYKEACWPHFYVLPPIIYGRTVFSDVALYVINSYACH